MAKNGGMSKDTLDAANESLKLCEDELKRLGEMFKDAQNIEDALKNLAAAKQLNDLGKLDGKDAQDAGANSQEDYEKLYDHLMKTHLAAGDHLANSGKNLGIGSGGTVGEDDSTKSGFKKEKAKTQLGAGRLLMEWKEEGVGDTGSKAGDYNAAINAVKQGVLVQCVAAPGLFIVVPAWFLFALGFDGFGAWIENPSFAREMANSLVLASICTLLAWLLSAFAERRAALVLAVPGLLGPLLPSLLLLAAAQPFDVIARTALPLVIALVLQLLPLALLLRTLLRLGADPIALHIARSSGAHAAKWTLSRGPAAGAVLLLFGVAYGDFTIGALLAPPQFTTVFARIFNLMHYGQNALLYASVFIAVATPLLCLWLTRRLLRLYVARRVR